MGMAALCGVLTAKSLLVTGMAEGAYGFIFSIQTQAGEDGIPHSQYAGQNQIVESYHKKSSP
jgi:hypothetical protein